MFRDKSVSQEIFVLAMLAVGAWEGCGRAEDAPDARPNVVLIVLGTTRADHLSAFGYAKPTSPRLAAFSADAIAFERAYATSTWTVPSHASLFTGLLPVTHGATQEHVRLDDELETLAELLSRRGYQSAAFSNNAWVSELTGLPRGFDEVFPMWKAEKGETGEKAEPAGDATGHSQKLADAGAHPTGVAALSWLSARDPGRPFLLFINLIEPHWPYDAPLAHQARFLGEQVALSYRQRSGFTATQWYLGQTSKRPSLLATRERMYDAELSYVDSVLGDLLDGIAAQGLLDESLVVVTSDHGENLGENGHQGHSFALYDPTLRVPLVIRPPGRRKPARRKDPVQLTDVFATIARAAGATPTDPRVVGRDLLSGPLSEDRPIVAESYRPDVFLRRFPSDAAAQASVARYRRRLRSIQIRDHKLITGSDGSRELYDMRRDHAEQRNLASREPERVRLLEERLFTLVNELERRVEPDAPGELDADTEKNLRALGYRP